MLAWGVCVWCVRVRVCVCVLCVCCARVFVLCRLRPSGRLGPVSSCLVLAPLARAIAAWPRFRLKGSLAGRRHHMVAHDVPAGNDPLGGAWGAAVHACKLGAEALTLAEAVMEMEMEIGRLCLNVVS